MTLGKKPFENQKNATIEFLSANSFNLDKPKILSTGELLIYELCSVMVEFITFL